MAEKSKKALVDKIVTYEGTDGKMHKVKEINYRTIHGGKDSCIVIEEGQAKPIRGMYTYYDVKPYGTIRVACSNFPLVLKTNRLK